MTHRKSFSLAFTLVYILFSVAVNAGTETGNNDRQTHPISQAEKKSGHDAPGKQAPASQDDHHKAPHGKSHAPHSEELPHIHKFHKERVKKITKHHGKCWFLSQALLLICHVAVLYISYLHVVH